MKHESVLMNFGRSCWDIFWVVVFTLLPTLIASIYILLNPEKQIPLLNFLYSGELIIYAISLMCSSYLTIVNYNKNKFIIPLLFFILFYSIIYGMSYGLITEKLTYNNRFIGYISISSIIIGAFCCLYSNYVHHSNLLTSDVVMIRENEQKTLDKGLS